MGKKIKRQAGTVKTEKLAVTKKHRIAALQKHVRNFPEDKIAASSLQKLLAGGDTNRRGGYKKKGATNAGHTRVTGLAAIAQKFWKTVAKINAVSKVNHIKWLESK